MSYGSSGVVCPEDSSEIGGWLDQPSVQVHIVGGM